MCTYFQLTSTLCGHELEKGSQHQRSRVDAGGVGLGSDRSGGFSTKIIEVLQWNIFHTAALDQGSYRPFGRCDLHAKLFLLVHTGIQTVGDSDSRLPAFLQLDRVMLVFLEACVDVVEAGQVDHNFFFDLDETEVQIVTPSSETF